MREALRRLLWLAPTLVGVTLIAFWAISRALTPIGGGAELPLFVNPKPIGVGDLSWHAAERVAAGNEDAEAAANTLVRLGGAALPHVLPRLDSLSPEGRQRVARALAPLAARMDTAVEQTLRRNDSAAEFWSRFWEENFVDFNEVIVRRVVSRYAQRASDLRERDLRRLDTFALDELITQMEQEERAGNVERLRRLTVAAAHVAENDWVLPPDGTQEAASALNSKWQSWWVHERRNFVNLTGVERLLSPLLQTRYATWVRETVRSEFGVLASGQPALRALRQRAPITLTLLLAGLFGGTLLGMLSGALTGLLRQRTARLLEGAFSLVLLALPAGFLITLGRPQSVATKLTLAATLMLLLGALLVSRYQRGATARLLNQRWVANYAALGASGVRRVLYTLRPSSNIALSTMAPHTSTLLSAAFVLEYALDLNGIGPTTIAALAQRELSWVMLVAVTTAAFVSVVQVGSDLLLGRLGRGGRMAVRESSDD